VKVALATCSALTDGWPDDALLRAALAERGVEASFEVWEAPAVDWGRFDRVLIRSTWDYTEKRDAFLLWADRRGASLRNPPALVRWNSDKRYLADLEAAGLPVVPTAFVEPDRGPPRLEGEVVIKPVVSAGARDTGRFGDGAKPAAEALLRRIAAAGRVAMVQPYLGAVDEVGETAIVFFAGRESHVLRKRAVLRPDEEAPIRDDGGIGAAEAMFDESLVAAGEADDDEHAVAERILGWVGERFGGMPLYARVDLVRDRDRRPLLLELEAVEPNLYLATAHGAAERLAEAVLDDLRGLG
jgi:hypothetical protein